MLATRLLIRKLNTRAFLPAASFSAGGRRVGNFPHQKLYDELEKDFAHIKDPHAREDAIRQKMVHIKTRELNQKMEKEHEIENTIVEDPQQVMGQQYAVDEDEPLYNVGRAQDWELEQINERIKMFFRRRDQRAVHGDQGQLTTVEDMEEFDKILHELAVYRGTGIVKESEIKNYKQILEIFIRRARRREFNSACFVPYLQFSASAQQLELAIDLTHFGFTTIFHKLSWTEKIFATDVAMRMDSPKVNEIVQMVVIAFQEADYEDIMKSHKNLMGQEIRLQTQNILQLMVVFKVKKVQNPEVWKKLELMMAALYAAEADQINQLVKMGRELPEQMLTVLNKQDIMMLVAIMAENNCRDNVILDLVQKDLKGIMDLEKTHFTQDQRNQMQLRVAEEMKKHLGDQKPEDIGENPGLFSAMVCGDFEYQTHILDCLFNLGVYDEAFIISVGQDALKSGNLDMENLVTVGVSKTLKYFRSIFFSRMLDERSLKKHQEIFMEFVDTCQDFVKGEVWLNILEITRSAGLNEFKDNVVRPKINDTYVLNELSLENLALVQKKMTLTPSQVQIGEDTYRKAHDRKSIFKKQMKNSSRKLRKEPAPLEPEVVSQE